MGMNRNSTLFIRAIFLFSLLAAPLLSEAADGSADKGKTLFEQKCSPCHTIGGGVKVGPDLKGITDLRPEAWIADFISNPEKMFQSRDPYATALLNKFGNVRMPVLGLSGDQVSDVLAYLASQPSPVKPATVTPKPAPVQVTQGSPLTGQQLFAGLISFTKGGPPCMSCHSVSGISFPGGGTLGPDLTGVYAKFGPTAINSILATLPFPTMKPIFDNHPLTLAEQQNLSAFFGKASAAPITNRTGEIALTAIGSSIVLLILSLLIWSNRLLTVRKSLVEQAVKTGGDGS